MIDENLKLVRLNTETRIEGVSSHMISVYQTISKPHESPKTQKETLDLGVWLLQAMSGSVMVGPKPLVAA